MSAKNESPPPSEMGKQSGSGIKNLGSLFKRICYDESPRIKHTVDFIATGGGQMKTAGWTVFLVCQIFCLILVLTFWHYVKICFQEINDQRSFYAETFNLKSEGESVPLRESQVLDVGFAGCKIYVYYINPHLALTQLYVLVPNEGYKQVQTVPDIPFWTNSFDGKSFIYSCSGIDFLDSPRWVKIKVEQQTNAP
jgi:hypothetical protein